eukprot:1541679-Karenia_brevis.AAC.1
MHVKSHQGNMFPYTHFETAWNGCADSLAKFGRTHKIHTISEQIAHVLTSDAFSWEWLRHTSSYDKAAYPDWSGNYVAFAVL